MQTNKTVEVFCSYAYDDENWLRELETHLSLSKRQGLLTLWYSQLISPGTDRRQTINTHLETADVILLLVSADFLASDYCYGIEMKRALERHQGGEAQVVPILIRPVDWKLAPFAHLRVLPTNAKPIALWVDKDAALADVSENLRRVLEGAPSLEAGIAHPVPLSIWNVPHRRNPHFTGRDELLDRLEQQLTAEGQNDTTITRRTALTQPQAIKGLGGIGKTQIAIEYAYRSRDQGYYTHTLWVNAASEDAMITSFVTIAEVLPSLPVKNETDQHKLIEAVKCWLEQCQQRWLLIFDNADDIALLRDYLPQAGHGSILLTTRAHAVGSLATSVEVETMGFLEGTHLLLRRAQRLNHASDEEMNQAGNIVVALDHFPLALDQAGAYIEESQCSLSDYLNLYQTHRLALLAQHGTRSTDYPHSVATTWLLSFQKVQQANPAAAELLQLCSFLAPDQIPEELFTDGAAHWPPLVQKAATNPFTFQQMIAELLKFSLVKRLAEEHTLSIHRLVQAVQVDMIEPEVQRQWAERVVRAVNKVFPDNPQDIGVWPRCLLYLDQAQACSTLIEQYIFPHMEGADLLNRTGLYLTQHALYTIAEPLYKRALAIRKLMLETQNQATGSTMTNLGNLYLYQGKYVEAEPLYTQVLTICEQQAGSQHPDTAACLHNMAQLYQRQGRYAEAEPLYLRALDIREVQLGPQHLDTANTLDSLGILQERQGRYEKAEPLYLRALDIREDQLGSQHLTTATSFNNLAAFYFTQGKLVEAEQFYNRALEVIEQHVGGEHPDTATCLNNLAFLYYSWEKYEKAEPLYLRALAIREQRLGPQHDYTATSLNNLAILYLAQKKYGEAEPLYLQALTIYEYLLGEMHPDIGNILNNLALLYKEQEKYGEAEPLYLRALTIYEQLLGEMHPDIGNILNNLAHLYYVQGQYDKVEPLYQRIIVIHEQLLGEMHLDTAQSLYNLAYLYFTWGKYTSAKPWLKRVLTIYTQIWGTAHPTTQSVYRNYVGLLLQITDGTRSEDTGKDFPISLDDEILGSL